MKTKKVVVGIMAAAVLSSVVFSMSSVLAAGETVQISVGTATAAPDEEFSVDVTMSDIPATGVQGCDFAVEYDNSLITVTSITAGALTKTGADEADESAALLPLFNSDIQNDNGYATVMWSTYLEDSSYWLQGTGVLCTINGTVNADAATGSTADIKVVAIDRETYPDSGTANTVISVGYSGNDGVVRYDVKTTDGAVEIGSQSTGLRGDANCDGEVAIGDSILILQYLADPDNYPITAQGKINADVYLTGDGINAQDSLQIQKLLAKQITEL